jgi:hypothetical protein
LSKFSRKDAAQQVVNIGGIVKDTVVKMTNFLVVGNTDYNNAEAMQTEKYIKAKKLINSGADLEIISETDFLDYLEFNFFEITQELVQSDSEYLISLNCFNEFARKTIYFSNDFRDQSEAHQLIGNCSGHYCYDDEIDIADYFIISEKEMNILRKGEKTEAMQKIENSVKKRLAGSIDCKLRCIDENTLYHYMNMRQEHIKGTRKMNFC